MVRLQELIYSKNTLDFSKVIGYRLYIDNKEFDFSSDLLDYVYSNYLKHGIGLKLTTKPLSLVLNSEGQYVSSSVDSATELSNEGDVDYFIGSRIPRCNTNLEHIENLLYYRYLVCRKMLLDCEIFLGVIENIKVNPKLQTTWGICYRRKSGYEYSYLIDISESLLIATNDYDGIDNTIIHELLHTCVGCFNHGTSWKRVAERVCNELGFDIKRLSSSEEKGMDLETLIKLGYYVCRCEDCNHLVYHKTKCQFVRHPEWYTCGCGGKFEKINY